MTPTLPEEAFALVLDPRAGRLSIAWGLHDWSAIEAALLAELAGRGAVALDARGRVVVRDAALQPEPYLDAALARIARRADRPRRASHWVAWLPYRTPDLATALGDALAARGLATRGERRILGLFRRPAWRPDAAWLASLQQRIRAALRNPAAAPPRDVTLAAILAATGNLDALLDKPERKALRRELRRLVAVEPLARAARDAIQSVYAASYVPTMVATG